MDISDLPGRSDRPQPDYAAATAALAGLSTFGNRPGLHRTAALLAALGNPHRRIPHVVHLAGTNGKGSTATMVSALLAAAGLSVAGFTSPHLTCYGERFVFDGAPLSRWEFTAAVNRVWPAVAAVTRRLGEQPVQFEVLASVMYTLAAAGGYPWLVQETGLGGRFDATNLIPRPDLTIITAVDLDHTDRLGATVAAVAAEKAGILKAGVPLVTTARGPAWTIIAARARELGITPHRVLPAHAAPAPSAAWVYELLAADARRTRFRLTGPAGAGGLVGEYEVPLAGHYQAQNGAAAVVALQVLAAARLPGLASLTSANVQQALGRVRWPARLEIRPGRPTLVIDGAHNPGAMAALRHSLMDIFRHRPLVLVCGVPTTKDLAGITAAWQDTPQVTAVHTVPVPGTTAHSPDQAAAAFRAVGLPAQGWDQVPRALAAAARSVDSDGIVVVCGSLYLAGWVRSSPWWQQKRSLKV